MGVKLTDDDGIISNINITPMVDVTLVLLIIFMVTATMIVDPGIKVELPKAANAEEPPTDAHALILDEEGVLFLDGEATTKVQAFTFLSGLAKGDPKAQVLIGAHRSLPYEEVIAVIDMVKSAGIIQFALNIERVKKTTGGG